MSPASLARHPYYLRTSLIMLANDWKNFNTQYRTLKTTYGFPLHKELKWSFAWSVRSHQKNGHPIQTNRPYKYLESVPYNDIIRFINESLNLLHALTDPKIVITVTVNQNVHLTESSILKFHLQEAIQRIEMELQGNNDNLGIFFIDPISRQKDAILREYYNELFRTGDYILNYSHIKDSILMENSHHSVGIQIADYISGATNSILKESGNGRYTRGCEMFRDHVSPFIRRNSQGSVLGHGLREVPRNQATRQTLLAKIQTNLNNLP